MDQQKKEPAPLRRRCKERNLVANDVVLPPLQRKQAGRNLLAGIAKLTRKPTREDLAKIGKELLEDISRPKTSPTHLFSQPNGKTKLPPLSRKPKPDLSARAAAAKTKIEVISSTNMMRL